MQSKKPRRQAQGRLPLTPLSGCQGSPPGDPHPADAQSNKSSARTLVQRIGLILGLVGLLIIAAVPPFDAFIHHAANALVLSPEHPNVLELARGTQMTLAITVIMVVWWLTEAAPIPITALLPGLLLPLLHVTGTSDGRLLPFDAKAAFAAYASPVIYLFLAGFLLAGAMRKTGLDRRITLGILSRSTVMRGPGTVLLAVMGITATLSMWMSNTATTAMMLPIALMILRQLGQPAGLAPSAPGTGPRARNESRPFAIAMMLGIAWSASIGGLGTIVGSPPNGIVVGILHSQSIATVHFLQWMEIGLPIAIVGVLAAWAILMIRYRPKMQETSAGLQAIRQARSELDPLKRDETASLLIFILVVILWITQPFWADILPAAVHHRLERFGIPEIGLLCGVLLFIVPLDLRDWRPVLDWRDAKYVDWGTLILFGGGITLSNAMFKTGLTDWLATSFVTVVGRPGPWLCLGLLVALVTLLTEITSNTAVTSMMTPILIGLAQPLGLPPVTLCLACAMASSLAFMLPVATPPNALVFASGYLRIGEMARAGFFMNCAGAVILVGGLYFIAGKLLGVLPL